MIRFVWATTLVFSGVLSFSVSANADALDAAMGNTVSIIRTDGSESRLYFNDNGSVSSANASGDSDIGTWRRDGEQVCIAWQSAGDSCGPLPAGEIKVGDDFIVISPEGAEQQATLMADKVPF